MSYLWSFQSFDADRLTSLFADPDGPALAQLIDLIGSDLAGFDDAIEAASTARAFIASGLSYDSLNIQQSRDADEIVSLDLLAEGLADDLGVAYLSDDGIHPSDVEEVLEGPTRYRAADACEGPPGRPGPVDAMRLLRSVARRSRDSDPRGPDSNRDAYALVERMGANQRRSLPTPTFGVGGRPVGDGQLS